jgi:hypothetical protein
MLEPIADALGRVQHPPVGQINAFVTARQPIPWAIALGYIWYFGLASARNASRYLSMRLALKPVCGT